MLHLTARAWVRHGDTYAHGQAHSDAGELLRALDIARLLDAAASGDDWHRAAASLNGCFAAVRATQAGVQALVDRVRSVPLFFAASADGPIVGDNADAVCESAGLHVPDADSAEEFALTGYVTGARTLIRGLRQIPAGQMLATRRGEAGTLSKWYAFEHRDPVRDSDTAMFDRLAAVHERVFRRLLADVGSRPLVLPLSGGYDSRLIAVMLRELDARDVHCFCYGAPGNWEARVSREVAAHLGFRWTSVEYTAQLWQACATTESFRRYFRQSGNLASVPHVQDWPAVHELARRRELPPHGVFVPGHTGDFLTGNHIPKSFARGTRVRGDELVDALLRAHYALWDLPAAGFRALRERLAGRIESVIGSPVDGGVEQAADVFERWEWQERQAKFIVNSVRVYEAFGHAWRLPWWDAELMAFWARVPFESRVQRRLFRDYMKVRHPLPVGEANADRSASVASAIRLVDRTGLRPFAKSVERRWRRARWRQAYERDPMAWFALVDPDEFRRRYTGRESGHAFFALHYLRLVADSNDHASAPDA